ncbi:hypothetical protein GPECTOR_92g595 [Gonium pectorale]|uniref:Uncharacterized protein n=1 Tax=Gonium pectorale TaxID=33097 RepID=A0A150G0J4_GONPE|nr:hypothetical protein GPECTOR_92g595 [Gonium pectorale]|eukprot:KXZ43372.1 hypothetical protein GPECTOR_92g595 [Gonium pectorale]
MGKSRGGKYHHKGRGPRKGPEEEEDSEEEVEEQPRLGGQRANVGMLPPSDSEEEEEDEKGGEGKAGPSSSEPAKEKDEKAGGQNKKAGKLPPSDGEDDDDDSDSSDDPTPEYLRAAPTARKKEPVVEPRSEEQIRKDLERLELIRKKREDDRLKRIATEGWDRYAPVTETNKPPGHVPSDHPSNKE